MGKRMRVLVETTPLNEQGEPEYASDEDRWQVVVDHNKRMHRQWLGRHCAWAFRNDYEVITRPTDLEADLNDEDWVYLKNSEARERFADLPGHEQSNRQQRKLRELYDEG